MGGLLAAEAATDEANYDAQGQYPGAKPRRIVGMMAFDTPYLGMHPHVVISGIASLFAKEDDKKSGKTEKELNTHPEVEFVDQHATDDWDSFKKGTEKGKHRYINLSCHKHLKADMIYRTIDKLTFCEIPVSRAPYPVSALQIWDTTIANGRQGDVIRPNPPERPFGTLGTKAC